MVLVISGINFGNSFLKMLVEIGSDSQVLALSVLMALRTCDFIIGAKQISLRMSSVSVVKCGLLLSASHILCILFSKKVANSSTRSSLLFDAHMLLSCKIGHEGMYFP